MVLRKVNNLLLRKSIVNKVGLLPISESGTDAEGDPYVRLKDGTVFYGNKTWGKYDGLLYRTLNKQTKKVLKQEALQVAMDVVIRYVEGGLQYGGPKKQSRYAVKKGDVVAEMGAYQGFCAIKLAQQAGEEGKVFCIEPMRENYRLLKKNINANNLNNVTCINRAVWDSQKDVSFNIRKNDNQSSSIEMEYDQANSYTIQADTLDNLFAHHDVSTFDLMIIQLNGAEINALRGLNNHAPRHLSIAARYDTEGEDAALIIQEFLVKKGYDVEIDEKDFVFARLN